MIEPDESLSEAGGPPRRRGRPQRRRARHPEVAPVASRDEAPLPAP